MIETERKELKQKIPSGRQRLSRPREQSNPGREAPEREEQKATTREEEAIAAPAIGIHHACR